MDLKPKKMLIYIMIVATLNLISKMAISETILRLRHLMITKMTIELSIKFTHFQIFAILISI